MLGRPSRGGLAALVVVAAIAASPAQAKPKPKKEHSFRSVAALKAAVVEHREATWYWQDIMLVRRTKSAGHEVKTKSKRYLHWLAKTWYHRRVAAKHRAENVPNLSAWLCIHRGEGSWTDPNAPYYGGLQMDMSFQRSYGWDALQRWGTADHWHPLTQMWVAERARASGRGFYPWPTTARACKLI